MKKNITVEKYVPQTNRTVKLPEHLHPSERLARSIVKWMDNRGQVAPSVILAQGLYLSRVTENDELPVEFVRSHVKTLDKDVKLIREIMEEFKKPGVDRVKVLSVVFKFNWADKKPAKKTQMNRNAKYSGKPEYKKTSKNHSS